MGEMQNRIEDFNVFDSYKLDQTETEEFWQAFIMRIFTHRIKGRENLGNASWNRGSYLYSKYHRILPEDLREPLMSRRVRAFIPGYDATKAQGYKSDDHLVGSAMLYRVSRPHFLVEVDYLRPIRQPKRYFYEFVPHEQSLYVAQQTSDTDQLFLEAPTEQEQVSDVMGFRQWVGELGRVTNMKNGYKEGMRKGPKLPEGMKFAWPILSSSVVIEPRYQHQVDLPF